MFAQNNVNRKRNCQMEEKSKYAIGISYPQFDGNGRKVAMKSLFFVVCCCCCFTETHPWDFVFFTSFIKTHNLTQQKHHDFVFAEYNY
jgi:hypothetical protein